MSIVKKIGIDGQDVLFKASAAIPRIYRLKFQRDIYKDLRILEKSIGEGDEEHSNLDLFSLEMFENIAYTMAKHADPELIKLWGLNVQTDVEAKKLRPTEREMTTPLFLLRCVQLGISMSDMELLSIGLINDMYSESRNDEWKYCEIGTQEDMDLF